MPIELIDMLAVAEGKHKGKDGTGDADDFAAIVLENLKTDGVQQAHKVDRITFTVIADRQAVGNP